MIGTIHIQVAADYPPDTKELQNSVEQVLLSNITGLSQVAVQIERDGTSGFGQVCFCRGSRLRNAAANGGIGGGGFKGGWAN
jgi:zinc transporter 5/7